MKKIPWYWWLVICCATMGTGYAIGLNERDKGHVCEFTTAYRISPGLTIQWRFVDGVLTCDTLSYTYRDFGR